MKRIIIAAIVLLFLCSCSSKDLPPSPPPPGAEVFVGKAAGIPIQIGDMPSWASPPNYVTMSRYVEYGQPQIVTLGSAYTSTTIENWHKIYILQNEVWRPITTTSSVVRDGWVSQRSGYIIKDLEPGEYYVIAYNCMKVSQGWDCNDNKWMLMNFEVLEEGESEEEAEEEADAVCGNNVIEPGEECDGTERGNCTGRCKSNCKCANTYCGDGYIQALNDDDEQEQCDPPGTACMMAVNNATGVCNQNCQCEAGAAPTAEICGDGIVEGTEECEEHSDCSAGRICVDCECVLRPYGATYCGDGTIQRPDDFGIIEDCDYTGNPFNPANAVGCSPGQTCHPIDCQCMGNATGAICGNNIVETGEECEDDGDCTGDDVCENCTCAAPTTEEPVCGNDIIESGEECENDSDCNAGETCDNCTCMLLVEYPNCLDDEDCQAGEICVSGTCVECETTADCTGEKICVGGTCEEPECDDYEDCAADEMCEEGSCVPAECITDDDCPDGYLCEARRCYEVMQCNTTADCPNMYTCENGICEFSMTVMQAPNFINQYARSQTVTAFVVKDVYAHSKQFAVFIIAAMAILTITIVNFIEFRKK